MLPFLFYQVQYEELHDDEIDFPDELFVIPKSASDELTPDLLTPERERREMKPAIANDWKIQQNGKLHFKSKMFTLRIIPITLHKTIYRFHFPSGNSSI